MYIHTHKMKMLSKETKQRQNKATCNPDFEISERKFKTMINMLKSSVWTDGGFQAELEPF